MSYCIHSKSGLNNSSIRGLLKQQSRGVNLVDHFINSGLLVSRPGHDVFIISRDVTAQDGWRLFWLRREQQENDIINYIATCQHQCLINISRVTQSPEWQSMWVVQTGSALFGDGDSLLHTSSTHIQYKIISWLENGSDLMKSWKWKWEDITVFLNDVLFWL